MTLKNRNNIESPWSGEFRFITDASLAGLARWLRITGYDTTVFDQEAGRNLLRMAEKESRIVLTRRRDMMDRQFPAPFFNNGYRRRQTAQKCYRKIFSPDRKARNVRNLSGVQCEASSRGPGSSP